MDIRERAALGTLHSIKGLGNRSLQVIKNTWGSFYKCFTCEEKDINKLQLPLPVKKGILKTRYHTNPEEYYNNLTSSGINILTMDDDQYPDNLRNISNPPYILYYQGKVELLSRVCLAIVGSRKASPYGKSIARKMASELSDYNIIVVSGMARGIDTEAHWGTLKKGGCTVAVLGSGLDIIYPPENKSLFAEIIKSDGLIVTEFSPGTKPEPGNFPRRNRIISGLCRGVIVVEARAKSGALITADFALEQGRDVFAIPGPITNIASEGPHNLIKQGAKLVTKVNDILEEYGDINCNPGRIRSDCRESIAGNKEKYSLLQYISYEKTHVDDIYRMSGMEFSQIQFELLQMELEGIVKAIPGNYYVRI